MKYKIFKFFYLNKKPYKIFLQKRVDTKLLAGLMAIPETKWYDNKFTLNTAKNMAPMKLNWITVPGILRYNISSYKLEIRFLRAKIKKKVDIQYGRWIKKNRINSLPISTLTKKILSHLGLF